MEQYGQNEALFGSWNRGMGIVVIFLLKTILLFVKLFHLGIIPGQNFNPQIVGFESSTKQVGFPKNFQ